MEGYQICVVSKCQTASNNISTHHRYRTERKQKKVVHIRIHTNGKHIKGWVTASHHWTKGKTSESFLEV